MRFSTNYLIILSVSSLFCKMGVIIPTWKSVYETPVRWCIEKCLSQNLTSHLFRRANVPMEQGDQNIHKHLDSCSTLQNAFFEISNTREYSPRSKLPFLGIMFLNVPGKCLRSTVCPCILMLTSSPFMTSHTAHSFNMWYNAFVGEGNGTPLQYSCLENPMDGGAWWAAVHGVSKSQTRLSDFTFTFQFHALEKEMATHSSVLAWRIPGTGRPGGLPSMGSHRVGHDWSDLAA